jgi:hypothetical protein
MGGCARVGGARMGGRAWVGGTYGWACTGGGRIQVGTCGFWGLERVGVHRWKGERTQVVGGGLHMGKSVSTGGGGEK